MKTDARNIYLRGWRKQRKCELEALRARLILTAHALEAAGELIEAYENMKEYEDFEKYQQAYRAALARLDEVTK